MDNWESSNLSFGKKNSMLQNVYSSFRHADNVSYNIVFTYGKPSVIIFTRLILPLQTHTHLLFWSNIFYSHRWDNLYNHYQNFMVPRGHEQLSLHSWIFVRGNLNWSPVDSTQKVSMMRKVFPRYDVLMFSQLIAWWNALIYINWTWLWYYVRTLCWSCI